MPLVLHELNQAGLLQEGDLLKNILILPLDLQDPRQLVLLHFRYKSISSNIEGTCLQSPDPVLGLLSLSQTVGHHLLLGFLQ